MPTSGVTDWPLTAGELIQHSMIELGVLSSGEEPEAGEMADCLVRLNGMLKSWSKRVNLFREASGTLTITGGTGAATLEQGIQDLLSVRHVVSATNYRQLAQWNRDQYYSLPNRAAVGNPTIYYLSKGVDSTAIRVWPVPATDITLHVDYTQTAETVTSVDETVDVPQEWQEAVILGLASRCASIFGATRLDPQTVARIDARAAELYQFLLDSDRPDSYSFETWDYPCA